MRLLWLPDVLRDAGLRVHVVAGWQTRGEDKGFNPRGIVCHETRGSRNSTDAGEIRVLLNGSPTAPPPIAQLYLSRTGDWHVIASGRCNHVLVGWAGPFRGVGNTNLVGIEAQHALGEPWTPRQYDSYVRGVAAMVRHTGWGIVGHKEHQPYPPPPGKTSTKTDPAFDMNRFRRDVTALLASGMEDDIMAALSDAEQRELLKGVRALVGRDEARIAATPAVKTTWAADPKGVQQLRDVQALAEIRALVKAMAGGSAEQVIAEIRRQGEQTRAAIADVDEQVVERLATADVDDLAGILRRGMDPERLAELAAALTALAQG